MDLTEWVWQVIYGKYEPIPTDRTGASVASNGNGVVHVNLLPILTAPKVSVSCRSSKGLLCLLVCGNFMEQCLNVAAAVTCDSDGTNYDDYSTDCVTSDSLMSIGNDFDYAEEIEAQFE